MKRTRRKNIDPAQGEQKREAVQSVVVSALARLLAAGVLLATRDLSPWPRLHRLLLWLSLAGLISIPLSLWVLRQRFREIEKGELEDAKGY